MLSRCSKITPTEFVENTRLAVDQAKAGMASIPHCGKPFESSFDHPFSWQCLDWFDAFPAPMDRHVTEFFPQLFRDGSYYGKTLGIDEFSFEETIRFGDKIYDDMHDSAYLDKQSGEQEQVVEIIQAILRNEKKVFFANLPNTGQAPNLPKGMIVETPAVTDGLGIHAIQQSGLPTAAAGIVAARFAWTQVVSEAAMEGNREKFIQALILDGAVQSPDIAVRLADELILAQSAYLPKFRQE